MKGRIVICDYCGTPADFVDSSVVYHGHSFGMIYLCPRCGAYVGVKDETTPIKRSGMILHSAAENGAEMVVTACPLCLYNLNKYNDTDVKVVYFTELLAEALGVK